MMRITSLFAAFILCSACTQSVGQHMNASVPCNQPSSTVDEAECFAKDSDAADKELNSVYAQVRSALRPEERSDLLEAQRAC